MDPDAPENLAEVSAPDTDRPERDAHADEGDGVGSPSAPPLRDALASEAAGMDFFPFAGAKAAHGAVRRALERGVGCILISGPDGIGKTRLLTDLSQRLSRRFQVVHLPLAALPPAELLTWAVGALRIDLEGDPAQQLLEHSRGPRSLPVVLTIDEAQSMPMATARAVADLVEQSEGRIHAVLALSPDERAPRVGTCFGADIAEVAFERSLSPDEAHAFLEALLESRGERAHLDENTVEALYTTSGGLPGRLAELARGLLPSGSSRVQASPLPLETDADPFATTSNVDAYVPRPATEGALDELVGHLRGGAAWLALIGPPGLGKTQTLRVLSHRLEDEFHPLHVGYGALEPDELERWIATLLGSPAGAASLLTTAREFAASGSPLVLLADDATAIPSTSLAWLREQAVASEGALRVVLAASDQGGVRPLSELDSGSPPLVRVALTDLLDEQETEAIVRARLRSASAPEPLRRAFNARSVQELHEQAEGNPAALERLADARVRDLNPPSSSPEANARPMTARPAAFEPKSVEQPRWLQGARAVLVLGSAGALAIALFLIPAMMDWRRDVPLHNAAEGPAERVQIHINASPWAEVTIDGEDLGMTPLGNVDVEVGTHRLEATLPDGTRIEREIFVDATHRHVVVNP